MYMRRVGLLVYFFFGFGGQSRGGRFLIEGAFFCVVGAPPSTCVCVGVWVGVGGWVCVCVCEFCGYNVCVHVCVCLCVYVCVYVHVCVCVCVYINT